MTKAFLDGKPTIWMPKGEDLAAPKTQHGIDPAVFTVFDQQTKTWDLGGGRVITPLLVRGHTNGCTAYTLRSESIIFTGDCLGLGRGILLRNAAGLKDWASDTDKLVSYIKANFTPYQRFALKVFTGHSSASPIEGYLGPDHGPLDLAWLDWRFLQDQALCGNAMLKGLWLSNESGLRLIQVTDPNTGAKTGTFLFGIGAVEMPVPEAYKAAGIKMTE